MASFSLSISPDAWEPTGSEGDITSRLYARLSINGRDHHMEAIAVTEDGEGQCAADPQFQRAVETYQSLEETTFETLEINGRDYIVVVAPRSR